MNRHVLTGAVVLACLCFIISIAYACVPLDIDAYWRIYKGVGSTAYLHAWVNAGGPAYHWDWDWPSGFYYISQSDEEYDSYSEGKCNTAGVYEINVTAYSLNGENGDTTEVYIIDAEIENNPPNRDTPEYIAYQTGMNIYYKIEPTSGGWWAPSEVKLYIKDESTSSTFREQTLSNDLGEQTAYWDGKHARGWYAEPGQYTAKIEVRIGGTYIYSDPHSILVLPDLDIDSDRSGSVDGTVIEDYYEDIQFAIVPVNCDDDDDPKDGVRDCDDGEINGTLDELDLIPMIIRQLPLSTADWTVTLTRPDSDTFNIFDNNKELLDDDVNDNDWVGNVHELTTGVGGERETLFNGDLTYYIEATRFPNSANETFTFTLTVTGAETFTDEVLVRPSPFILLPGGSGTVYAPDRSSSDQDDEIAGVGDVIVSMDSTYAGDPWLQDAAEIGYTKWPGGQMNVVMNLPRTHPDHRLEDWPNTLLFSNIGVFPINSGGGVYDYGGNIEATGEDYVVVGEGFSLDITNFIVAQGIQSVITATQTEYLSVGHIDELVSFSGSTSAYIADVELGISVIEKFINNNTQDDGDVANATEEYFEILSGGWDDDQWIGAYLEIHDVTASKWQYRQVISNTGNRIYVYDATNDIGVPLESPYPNPNEWKYYLTARSEMRSMFSEGEEISGVVTDVQDNGKKALDTSGLHDFTEVDWVTDGYAIIFFYNTAIENYDELVEKITATTSTSFTLENSISVLVLEGSYYVLVQKSKKGNAFQHVYLGDPEGDPACITVRKFWETYSASQSSWDSYLEDLRTLLSQQAGISSFTSVPVLFDITTTSKAKAALPNMVNMSSTGAVPNPFGPRNSNGEDQFIFDSPFGSCIDCWPLHSGGGGEIHCATNAIPSIPSTNWWQE